MGSVRRLAPAPRRRRLHERISDRPPVARRPRHPHLRRHQRNHEGSREPRDLGPRHVSGLLGAIRFVCALGRTRQPIQIAMLQKILVPPLYSACLPFHPWVMDIARQRVIRGLWTLSILGLIVTAGGIAGVDGAIARWTATLPDQGTWWDLGTEWLDLIVLKDMSNFLLGF